MLPGAAKVHVRSGDEARTTTIGPVPVIVCKSAARTYCPESYAVWEAADGHSSITYGDDGVCYGQVNTRPLPDHLDRMAAFSDERIAAVRAYRAGLDAACRGAIFRAFPEIVGRQELALTAGAATVTLRALDEPDDRCQVCRGSGAEPLSDNVNWLPCSACRGTGKRRAS